jgi:hypothetical protein
VHLSIHAAAQLLQSELLHLLDSWLKLGRKCKVFLRRLLHQKVLRTRYELVVLYVADEVRVLWHECWVCLLLQLGALEDVEVLQRDLDLEVVFLVIEELQIRLFLSFRQGNFLFALFDPRQLHFHPLLLGLEVNAAVLAQLFCVERLEVVKEAIAVRNHLLLCLQLLFGRRAVVFLEHSVPRLQG